MREVTKGMPEDIIAENLSKSVAVWGIAFRIGVPETNMLECGKI
jgi:hypothetical protein